MLTQPISWGQSSFSVQLVFSNSKSLCIRHMTSSTIESLRIIFRWRIPYHSYLACYKVTLTKCNKGSPLTCWCTIKFARKVSILRMPLSSDEQSSKRNCRCKNSFYQDKGLSLGRQTFKTNSLFAICACLQLSLKEQKLQKWCLKLPWQARLDFV